MELGSLLKYQHLSPAMRRPSASERRHLQSEMSRSPKVEDSEICLCTRDSTSVSPLSLPA